MASIPKSTELLIQKVTQAISGEEPGKKITLHNGQVARVVFERRTYQAPVSDDGDRMDEYPRAYVDLGVPRADAAVIAAVTALRGETIAEKEMLYVHRQLPAARWNDAALRTLGTDEPRPEAPSELNGAKEGDVFKGYRFMLADDLLRHFRDDYGERPLTEQVRLVIQVLQRTNEFLEAARRLALCIQHADPSGGLPTTPIKNAERDVRAAELRDIEGLSFVEIGKRLKVKQFSSEKVKGDNRRLREEIVPNGRKILREALGDAGYQEHIKSAKAVRERHRNLSKEERKIEDWAELVRVSGDDMRRMMTGTEEDFAAVAATLDEIQAFQAALARYGHLRLPRE
jgi:hypothetical protein